MLFVTPLATIEAFLGQFADDTNATSEADNYNQLISKTNRALGDIVEWVFANKLKLNARKSHFLVFTGPRSRHSLPIGSIKINGIAIEQKFKTTFLGINIDDSLLGDAHTKHLYGRLGFAVATVVKARSHLHRHHLLLIFQVIYYMVSRFTS
jgi:hypothetical protein